MLTSMNIVHVVHYNHFLGNNTMKSVFSVVLCSQANQIIFLCSTKLNSIIIEYELEIMNKINAFVRPLTFLQIAITILLNICVNHIYTLTSNIFSCADLEGGSGGSGPPLEFSKLNIADITGNEKISYFSYL